MDDNPNPEQPAGLIDLLHHHLFLIYEAIKHFPQPLNERETTANSGQQTIRIEDTVVYRKEFYSSLISLSDSTNALLEVLFPIYTVWFNGDEEKFASIIKDNGLTLQTLSRLYSQARAILAHMEEYLMLAHYYMPSWRFLGQMNYAANTIRLNVPSAKQVYLESSFFYELCRILAVTDIVNKLKKYSRNTQEEGSRLSGKSQGPTEESQRFTHLASLGILPARVMSKWKFPYDIKPNNKGSFMIPYYSQSQLDLSFEFLFLKLNLLPYHSGLEEYIYELLYRMAWLVICPHPPAVLDMDEYCAELSETVMNDLDENFVFSPEIYNQFHPAAPTSLGSLLANHQRNGEKIRVCNRNFVYRFNLRYNELILKLAFRSFFFKTKRISTLDPKVREISNWLRTCLNRKYETINVEMKTEVCAKHADLLIPPSDKEWAPHKYPNQYVSENSIWTIMYPELKVMNAMAANKDPKDIFRNPAIGEGTIFEFIVLKLTHMIFARVDFLKHFVIQQSNLVEQLQYLQLRRRMPVLIQSFNRYALLYRTTNQTNPLVSNSSGGNQIEPRLVEYPSIFDAIGALLVVMIKQFPSEAATMLIIEAMNKQKVIATNKPTSSQALSPTVVTNQFSTMQTSAATTDSGQSGEDDESRKGFF